MFAGLLAEYVNAINDGGVPTISSAWDHVAKAECAAAADEVVAAHAARNQLAGSTIAARLAAELSAREEARTARAAAAGWHAERSAADAAPAAAATAAAAGPGA